MLRACVALLLGFWLVLAGAQELQPVPARAARVTDLTSTLTPDQQNQLEGRLAALEREKGAQFAVLIVPTVKPETIEQYALRVAEQWKLGRKGVDDGVLLLVAKQDRKLRIEVGYGLEGALNDATAKRIIAEVITPQFKAGHFYEGIDAGVLRIVDVIGGEPLPPPKTAAGQASGDGFDVEDLLIVGLVLVTVVAGILRAIFGRFLSAAMVGGLAGFIVMLIASSLLVAGVVGVIVFVLALITGGRGGVGGGWGGGFSGGSSSGSWGGSDSGGFSGGGGSFGGGGASGDW